jgi:L-asparaginase II
MTIKGNPTGAVPLVEVRRGAIVESRHRGHLYAVDGAGNGVATLGAPETVTYLRSSAKPFQMLPLITSGAADRFAFTEPEIAVACASHNGEPIHTETVAGMLRKIGLDESFLKCGVHEPFSAEVTRQLREDGEKPTVLHNNCSGKHTGFLALALHVGAPVETYDQITNPVQLAVLRVIAEFSGESLSDIELATDGCGAPVFGMPIKSMALMYARLVNPPAEFTEEVRTACDRIVSAMTKHPEMIGGGLNERLDTEVMRATGGAVVSKVGAEGVYTSGVRPCEQFPTGLGLAFKIEDGEDRRARPTVVIEALRQLGVIDDGALSALQAYARFSIKNHRGDLVGEIKPNFELEFNAEARTQ